MHMTCVRYQCINDDQAKRFETQFQIWLTVIVWILTIGSNAHEPIIMATFRWSTTAHHREASGYRYEYRPRAIQMFEVWSFHSRTLALSLV